MKLRVDLHGLIIEYERRPVPEHRFKLLCLLAASGIYAGMVCGVAALCGGWGLVTVGLVSLIAILAASY